MSGGKWGTKVNPAKFITELTFINKYEILRYLITFVYSVPWFKNSAKSCHISFHSVNSKY